MNIQTFYDYADELGVTNRDKIAQRQRVIRRIDTTAKDVSFEATEGRHDGAVIVDGKLIGFGIHIFNEDIYPLQSFEIYLRGCDLTGDLDLSGCDELLFVDVYHNRLRAVDVSGDRALRILGLQDNQIEALDVRDLRACQGIDAGRNRLSELDVSQMASSRSCTSTTTA